MKVLVLAPHTDDGEISCGGTIFKFMERNDQVTYVGFSFPAGSPHYILREEVKKAMKVLGADLILFTYEVRNFPIHRQKILDNMTKLEEDIKPDLVLLPSTYDTHQDHQVVSQEGFRAFKKASILGYEVPYNNYIFNAGAFVPIEERHLVKKVEAVLCYSSQQGKRYLSEECIRSLAINRGMQIGIRYAEAFEVVRWVIK